MPFIFAKSMLKKVFNPDGFLGRWFHSYMRGGVPLDQWWPENATVAKNMKRWVAGKWEAREMTDAEYQEYRRSIDW